MTTIQPIRPSPIAGTWYSSNSNNWQIKLIFSLQMQPCQKLMEKSLVFLHRTQATNTPGRQQDMHFKAIKDQCFDLVVILSPFHAYHSASVLSSAHLQYATPFGNVPVAQELLKLFSSSMFDKGMQFTQIANDKEHSLEIEIPFLQRSIIGNFEILPLMIRHIEPDEARLIANILYDLIKNRKVLIVISSDLSHFYSDQIAQKLDSEMLSKIASYATDDVYRTEKDGKGFACGLGAIMVGMELTRHLGGDEIKILSSTNSGEITGDLHSVVGYGAAAFIKNTTDQNRL